MFGVISFASPVNKVHLNYLSGLFYEDDCKEDMHVKINIMYVFFFLDREVQVILPFNNLNLN